jgi:hypothetical protein
LSISCPYDEGGIIVACDPQVLNKGRSAGFAKDKSMVQVDSWSRFSGFFPQALRIYIWFLEAADSHRLSMQMIWSIKGKIHVLTE